jgi:hypothetical protein
VHVTRIRAAIVLAAIAVGAGSLAHAACNTIPSASRTFRGALGSTDRPFTTPDRFLEVQVRPDVCDAASPGLGATAEEHVVTVVFTPPRGGPRNVVVLATDCTDPALEASRQTCEQRADVATATCVEVNRPGEPIGLAVVARDDVPRLQVRFPDTDALLAPDGDGQTLSGPAAIAVTSRGSPLPCALAQQRCTDALGLPGLIACVDELFARDGTCRTTPDVVDPTFGHFTALPPPNDYQAVCTDPSPPCTGSAPELRLTTDAAGNALLPMSWRGILVEAGDVPVPRLLRGSTALSPDQFPGVPIRFPGPEFVASYTLEGIVLPPVFEPQLDPRATNELTLFGSADAPETVLRVARRQLALVCTGGTRDRLPCDGTPDCPEGGVCGPELQFFACVGGAHDGLPCTHPTECPGGACAPTTCVGGADDGAACASDRDCAAGECGPGLFEFRDRLVDGVGPVVVAHLGAEQGVCDAEPNEGELCTDPLQCSGGRCVGYRFEAETPVPLEGLAGTGDLLTLVVDEPIAGSVLNGDGDSLDSVLTLRDRATGEIRPIGPSRGARQADGRAVARIRQPPFSFPAFAAEGSIVAFLEPEVLQGEEDANADFDSADTVLRVFRREQGQAVELTAAVPDAVDAEPLLNGASVVVSGGRVFARVSEPGRAPQFTGRASVRPEMVEANGASGSGDRGIAFAANGRFLAFTSAAANLVDGDTNVRDDVVVLRADFVGGILTILSFARVSVSATGEEASGDSGSPALSADGRFVAFVSEAVDLVAGDGNGLEDVFVHDRDIDGNGIFDDVGGIATVRVSVDTAGGDSNGVSADPSLSRDGRFVAFASEASDLVTNDSNGAADVFVRDRDSDGNGIFDETGGTATVRVSVDSSGAEANGASVFPEISADGRFVAFASDASDLVPADANGVGDVFIHDRDADGNGVFDEPGAIATTRVSVDSAGTEGNGDSLSRPSLSADGRVVAFDSVADDLVAADTNGVRDVFVRYWAAGQTVRASIDAAGRQGDAASTSARLSANGRLVAFESRATTLVAGDANGVADVFLHDLLTGITSRTSAQSTGVGGGEGNAASVSPALSADGRITAFRSAATNLDFLLPDTNGLDDVYVGGGVLVNDIDGDGDGDDTVLAVLDPVAMSPFLRPICSAEAVAVASGRAAFLHPEASGTTTACQGRNRDLDAADDIVQLWLSSTEIVHNLWCAATTVALSSSWVVALVSEADEGGTDLNADGDASDTVVAAHPVTGADTGSDCVGPGSRWIHLGQAADSVRVAEVEVAGGTVVSVVAFTTPEAAQGEDLNGDGDLDDRVFQLWTLDPVNNTASKVTGLDEAAEEVVRGGTLVAFRTPEAAEGQDLNGDGDQADFVLNVYDVATNTLHASGYAATPCQLAACDPRQPYRVVRDGVKFLTRETEQSADLNNDGDALDLVIQLLNVRSGIVRTLGTIEDVSGPSVNPLQGGEADADDGSQVFLSTGRCLETLAGSCAIDADCGSGAFCTGETCAQDHGPCTTDADCPQASLCRPEPTVIAVADTDRDGFPDPIDVCPSITDPAQIDTDGDGVGDACDQETVTTTTSTTTSTGPTLSTSTTTTSTSTTQPSTTTSSTTTTEPTTTTTTGTTTTLTSTSTSTTEPTSTTTTSTTTTTEATTSTSTTTTGTSTTEPSTTTSSTTTTEPTTTTTTVTSSTSTTEPTSTTTTSTTTTTEPTTSTSTTTTGSSTTETTTSSTATTTEPTTTTATTSTTEPSTTTTPTSTTTTTTAPRECEVAPSFSSAACRAEALAAEVEAADLGPMGTALTRQLDRAAERTERAEEELAAGGRQAAIALVRLAQRRLIAFEHRIRVLARRGLLEPDLWLDLDAKVEALQADVRTLLRSL